MDDELKILARILTLLASLRADTRMRLLRYLVDRFGGGEYPVACQVVYTRLGHEWKRELTLPPEPETEEPENAGQNKTAGEAPE